MAESLVRIQFEMSRQKVRDLDRLMRVTSMRSRRELFDNALTFFEWGVAEIVRGNLVATVDDRAGCYQPMLMPAFVAARRFARSQPGKLRQAERTAPALAKRVSRNQPFQPRTGGPEAKKQLEPPAHTAEGAHGAKATE